MSENNNCNYNNNKTASLHKNCKLKDFSDIQTHCNYA